MPPRSAFVRLAASVQRDARASLVAAALVSVALIAVLGLADASVRGGEAAEDAPEDRPPLLRIDFDAPRPDKHSAAILGHKHTRLAPGAGPDGSNALRVAYVGFPRGSERVVLRLPLAREAREATLAFSVKFEKDFQWVRGGKLHGLGPAAPITGGKAMRPAGWSARLMWAAEGGARTYVYSQNKPGTYGWGQRTQTFRFAKDHWYRLAYHVRVNDPPSAKNGFLRVLADGREILRHEGLQYRAEGGPGTAIRLFLFSTFHGGSTPQWAPTDGKGGFATVHALFDDFVVHDGAPTCISVGAPAPATTSGK